MSEQTNIEWCDSTFNPWLSCTKVGPGCDHCYAETLMSKRMKVVGWGPGAPRKRTSEAYWKQPLRWNARAEDFRQCSACGWRGEVDTTQIDHRCPSCGNVQVERARRRVFCASLSDWLDNEAPIEWLVDLLQLIASTPHLDWLLLTKRVGNWKSRLQQSATAALMGDSTRELARWMVSQWLLGNPPANVWIGATICNQAEADRDIPKLLATPARVRFLSIEPMLGPVNLTRIQRREHTGRESPDDTWTYCDDVLSGFRAHACGGATDKRYAIDWVICGGESGPGARPMHPDWPRALRDQCEAAGVPFLFKQWGEWRPISEGDGDWYDSLYRPNVVARDGQDQGNLNDIYGRRCTVPTAVIHVDGSVHDNVDVGAWQQGSGAMLTFKVGKKSAGRLLDGVEHSEWPA